MCKIMCKWCNESKPDNDFIDIEDKHFTGDTNLNVGIEDKKIYAYTEHYFKEVDIKFCPFCGRKL